MPSYQSDLALQQRVFVDGDRSLTAVVTGLLWRTERAEVEISWVHNGDIKSAWVAPWRLKPVE
jgi:hypothetical protein